MSSDSVRGNISTALLLLPPSSALVWVQLQSLEGHGDSPAAQTHTHAISVEPDSRLHHSTCLAQDLSRVTVVAIGQLHMHFVFVKGCLPGEFIYPGRWWITQFLIPPIVSNLAMQLRPLSFCQPSRFWTFGSLFLSVRVVVCVCVCMCASVGTSACAC